MLTRYANETFTNGVKCLWQFRIRRAL